MRCHKNIVCTINYKKCTLTNYHLALILVLQKNKMSGVIVIQKSNDDIIVYFPTNIIETHTKKVYKI